jgi:hypothetical protein
MLLIRLHLNVATQARRQHVQVIATLRLEVDWAKNLKSVSVCVRDAGAA